MEGNLVVVDYAETNHLAVPEKSFIKKTAGYTLGKDDISSAPAINHAGCGTDKLFTKLHSCVMIRKTGYVIQDGFGFAGRGGKPSPGNSDSTGGTAKLGDSMGMMGEYVDNPGIKVDWSQYAEHGFERLTQRGMSKELVNSIVENGKALSQNNGTKFAFVTKRGVVVVSKNGKLITAWPSSYFNDAMIEIIESLFRK